MIAQSIPPETKAARTGRQAKAVAAVLLILAVAVMTVEGVAALKKGEDTSKAMELPAALALWSLIAFVYAQKRTLPPKTPNQPPEPTRSARGSS